MHYAHPPAPPASLPQLNVWEPLSLMDLSLAISGLLGTRSRSKEGNKHRRFL